MMELVGASRRELKVRGIVTLIPKVEEFGGSACNLLEHTFSALVTASKKECETEALRAQRQQREKELSVGLPASLALDEQATSSIAYQQSSLCAFRRVGARRWAIWKREEWEKTMRTTKTKYDESNEFT